jgi:hypothetical protein
MSLMAALTVLGCVLVAGGASATTTEASARTSAQTLTVIATAHASYDQAVYQVRAGLVKVRLVGVSGIALRFADRRYRHCLLVTGVPGGRTSCEVNLTRGSYLVYDWIGNHRAGGFEATVVVTP